MIAVFHAWSYDRFIKIASSGERNFIERIKAPIFLEIVLVIEIMQEPQSMLKVKDNPASYKMTFPQEHTHLFSHQ